MAESRQVLVKNTFIVVPESEDALLINFARQFSDPSPTRSPWQGNFMLDLASLSDPDEDLVARDLGFFSQESTGGETGGSIDVVPPPKQDLSAKLTHIAWAEQPVECFEGQPQPQLQPAARRHEKGAQKEQTRSNRGAKRSPQWDGATTVMMRNLPNKYKQQMLMDEIAHQGFHSTKDFDFFYLPMDHTAKANLGYCFINFVEPGRAWAFGQAFEGMKMRHFHSSKVVVVMPASMQGFEKNYAYYATSRVAQAEDPQYRPLFFQQPLCERAEREALQNHSAITTTNNDNSAGSRASITSKGRAGQQEQAGRERRKRGGDVAAPLAAAAGVVCGDASHLDRLHAVGNKVLHSDWYGASTTSCALCGTEITGHERFCNQCGCFHGQQVTPQGMYREGVHQHGSAHYAHAQEASCAELVDLRQGLDYTCGRQMGYGYLDRGSGFYSGECVKVAPR